MSKKNLYPLTVIVPAYNHEYYIKECLDSIMHQSFKDFKWIVVDDASNDNTPLILKKYQTKYGYELILNNENKGLSQTLTEIIKYKVDSDFLCICASDDFWCPDKLEIQINFFKNNPNFAMCFGKTYDINVKSEILGVSDCSNYKGGMIFEEIVTQKFHPPVNYMIRTSVIKEFGYYNENIIAEDFYMNCLISYKYQIGYIPKILGYYRVNALEKKRDPLLLYLSHEQTIHLFKNDSIYNSALRLHCLRAFSALSIYRKYKLVSINYFFHSLPTSDYLTLIRGFYHLLFYWRSV